MFHCWFFLLVSVAENPLTAGRREICVISGLRPGIIAGRRKAGGVERPSAASQSPGAPAWPGPRVRAGTRRAPGLCWACPGRRPRGDRGCAGKCPPSGRVARGSSARHCPSPFPASAAPHSFCLSGRGARWVSRGR